MPREANLSAMRRMYSAKYAASKDSWTRELEQRAAVRVLLEAFSDGPMRVLEIGAGRGVDTRTMLAHGHEVVAADLIAQPDWQAISAEFGRRVSFVAGDFLSAAIDGKFDGVLDAGCFHHQHPDDYVPYLRRVSELLNDGGLALFSLFAAEEHGYLHESEDGTMHREFSEREFTELAIQAGLTPVDFRRVARFRSDWHYLIALLRKKSS